MTDDIRKLVTELRALYAETDQREWRYHKGNIVVGAGNEYEDFDDIIAEADGAFGDFLVAAHNAMPRLLDVIESLLAVGTEDEYKAWVRKEMVGDSGIVTTIEPPDPARRPKPGANASHNSVTEDD